VADGAVDRPVGVRALRGVGSIDGYVERIVQMLTPAPIPAIAPRSEPMDLPLAIGYLDTTWKVKTGRRLFANLQADSCARLAQPWPARRSSTRR
jgi:hypothetical protein